MWYWYGNIIARRLLHLRHHQHRHLDNGSRAGQSLCGGMLNTAFQIGSGVALAISAAVAEAVDIEQGSSMRRGCGARRDWAGLVW
ncbi:hypothetical protein BDV26DRAFT_299172 [Aspergillus bertholletiae]|uniref:Uncharacterized protein n=1 Tax=Aspergillus bertholletiae TaxID=1226010 RepID=A0A5N7AMV5_9EURO|nr:hypothetical protein BDV26DRAFT_299172 [Aspergillus bertholletiae]